MKSKTKHSTYLTPRTNSFCLLVSHVCSWNRDIMMWMVVLGRYLMAQTELSLEMLGYLPFNHLMLLLAPENFIEFSRP